MKRPRRLPWPTELPGSRRFGVWVDQRPPAVLIYNQMVVDRLQLSDHEVDRLFHALADATRRDIVRRTLTDEASVSMLATAYDMSFAAVQKHVAVLEGAGLVTKRNHGRERLVRGNPEALAKVSALLDAYEQIARARIGRLDAIFESESRSRKA